MDGISNDAEGNAKEAGGLKSREFFYRSFGMVFAAALIFSFFALIISGVRFLSFESSYDRLAPVMQNAPAWYRDLAKDVIDHESMVADGVDFFESRSTAIWILHDVADDSPEKLAVPNAWLEKAANTPELTLSQLSHLRMMGRDQPYISTEDATTWLLQIERGIRVNQSDGWQAIDRRLKEGFSVPN